MNELLTLRKMKFNGKRKAGEKQLTGTGIKGQIGSVLLTASIKCNR